MKAQVDELRRQLVAKRPERFVVLGNWATGVLRQAAGAHVFFSNPVRTGKDAHTLLIQAIQAAPISATLDGRTGGG